MFPSARGLPRVTSNLRLSFAIPICEICVICGLFSLNQLLLSFQPPTVSAQTLIFPNDAVTWNHEGDVIARACAGDGAHSLRLADDLRNVLIRSSCSQWNPSQLFPYAPLKSGRSNIERQLDPQILIAEVLQNVVEPKIK